MAGIDAGKYKAKYIQPPGRRARQEWRSKISFLGVVGLLAVSNNFIDPLKTQRFKSEKAIPFSLQTALSHNSGGQFFAVARLID
jgi:hypothetical protein